MQLHEKLFMFSITSSEVSNKRENASFEKIYSKHT